MGLKLFWYKKQLMFGLQCFHNTPTPGCGLSVCPLGPLACESRHVGSLGVFSAHMNMAHVNTDDSIACGVALLTFPSALPCRSCPVTRGRGQKWPRCPVANLELRVLAEEA